MRQTCLNMVRELAKRDPRVVFIGSDLSPALCKSETPDRWFMEGVAEQNLIGMAAGMAMDGLIPYVNTIATFLTRRCYDQLAVDLCMHNLPVRLVGNGGGLVYSPLGPTHLAIEDIAIMRALPNMTVVAPCDADEMTRVMEASLDWPGPMYIRLARGGERIISPDDDRFEIGRPWFSYKYRDMGAPIRVAFMSTGAMTDHCMEAASILRKEDGMNCAVVHFPTIKPLDWAAAQAFYDAELVVTVEEGIRNGGLGSAISEVWHDDWTDVPTARLVRVGIPDVFPADYGTRENLWEQSGLLPAQLVKRVRDFFMTIASIQAAAPAPHPQSPSPVLARVL